MLVGLLGDIAGSVVAKTHLKMPALAWLRPLSLHFVFVVVVPGPALAVDCGNELSTPEEPVAL